MLTRLRLPHFLICSTAANLVLVVAVAGTLSHDIIPASMGVRQSDSAISIRLVAQANAAAQNKRHTQAYSRTASPRFSDYRRDLHADRFVPMPFRKPEKIPLPRPALLPKLIRAAAAPIPKNNTSKQQCRAMARRAPRKSPPRNHDQLPRLQVSAQGKTRLTRNTFSSAAARGARSRAKAMGLLKPTYPRLARERDEEGKVIYEVQIQANGAVTRIRLIKSSGFPLLDRAALRAVKRAKFIPATIDNRPVTSCRRISFVFRLEK